MPAYTSPDNIQYPTSGDQIAPLETVFANLAQSTQNALTAVNDQLQIHTFRWANAGERTAQTGMVAGDVGYQIDKSTNYIYTGSTWRIDNSGTVLLLTLPMVNLTFADAQNVFSANFNSYKIEAEITSASSADNMLIRLSSGATVISTANHISSYSETNSVTAAGNAASSWSNTQTGLPAGRVDTGGAYVNVTLSSPAMARRKFLVGNSIDSNGYGRSLHGTSPDTTARDGFRFTRASGSGTMSGTIRVYGLRP